SYTIEMKDCVFKQVAQANVPFNAPIFFEVTDYSNASPRFGGAQFDDCLVVYGNDEPFFDLYENLPTSDGLGRLSGHFTVVNPYPQSLNLGSNPLNASLNFQRMDSLPQADLSFHTSQDRVLEGTQVSWQWQRNGPSLDFPISQTYELDGTVTEGKDVAHSNGFIIFPANQTEISDSLATYQDDVSDDVEALILYPNANDCAQLQTDSVVVLIVENLTTSLSVEGSSALRIFPNPTSDFLQIDGASISSWHLFSTEGRKQMQGHDKKLNIKHLPKGVFILEVVDHTGKSWFGRVVKK
ncbi:MAG: T9SS type A sorting domain-containing protein, partial [Bacteroidota bacterium]